MIGRAGRVRIADVAREAKVSTATVDRVLNKRAGVRGATCERVLSAFEKLSAGGTAGAVEPAPLMMDFVLPSGAGPTFDENLRGAVEAEAAGSGATLRWHRFERFNPAALADQIVEIARQGSDGLAIHALEHPLVREAVDRVTLEGTPVIAFLSDLVGSRRVAYVGADNRAAGRTTGYVLGRFSPKEKGKVLVLAGSHLYRAHEEREKGFRGVCREYFPWLEVMDVVIGNDEAEDNYRKVRSMIDLHPDLVGMYNLGSGNRGVVRALKETGRDQDVVFIIHNLTSVSRTFLLDGTVDAVAHLNMDRTVQAATDLAMRVREDKPVRSTLLPFEILFRENVPT
jgi:LacI family transcriptional regulator